MLSYAPERATVPRVIRDRTSGAVLALMVQAGLVLPFLLSSQYPEPLRAPARETILLLHPSPQSAPPTIDARGASPRKPMPIQLPILPNIMSTSPAPPAGIADFGRSLFGCAPENLANLDEAQRSRCRKIGALASHDPGAVDFADHRDEVRGARQWKRELVRKKAPLLLPCGNAKAFDFVYTGGCILANIANGFTFQKQYDNQPAYSDESGK
ncbi:MAG: hypothetical protein V4601_14245 [Pseudomonadota bacterium]